jgi:hypothetical protein
MSHTYCAFASPLVQTAIRIAHVRNPYSKVARRLGASGMSQYMGKEFENE